ncbi:MAG TPA: DNA-processing protein DprA [Thermoanaerobaculia bacterium]|nr:DNA-processing protein DprA [Thermoanaerobaculia bacterium]
MHIENRDRLIAYSLLPFLSPSRTRLLREHFDSFETISSASAQFLGALLSVTPEQAEAVKNPLTNVAEEKLALLRGCTITLTDPDYPALLKEIIDPPLALHFRGDRALLTSPCVAIVGSRRASPYGINAARHLARQLVEAGLTIVSGLALGIDAAAHEAALDGGGRTIAVLGTGVDLTYPRSNAKLFRRIETEGLIVSEFGPGTPPLPENFPVRNRVISGLSLGAVIVEATGRSGSLITARMAAEQGREVFAVPGSIFCAGTEGTHRLIQYGAKLVHDAGDVLEELPGEFRMKTIEPKKPPAELRDVLAVLSREEASHIDSIAQRLSCAPGAVAESLLQLELGGWVRALPGGRYVRTPGSGQ